MASNVEGQYTKHQSGLASYFYNNLKNILAVLIEIIKELFLSSYCSVKQNIWEHVLVN